MSQGARQHGFAAIEAILIFVIVAIVGGTGYFVYQANNNVTDTYDAANNAASQPVVKPKKTTTTSTAGLQLTSPNFYDCVDVSSIDTTTCTLKGVEYTLPTKFTDDNIRNTSGLTFTDSEVAYLREIGEKNFKSCKPAPMFGTIRMLSEANGKFLLYGVDCDGGHRELAYLDGTNWMVIYAGQDSISCDTMTKYKVPKSLFATDEDGGECFTSNDGPTTKIKNLNY